MAASSVRFTEPTEEEKYRGDGEGGARPSSSTREVKGWGFVELIEQLLLNHDAPAADSSSAASGVPFSTLSSGASSVTEDDLGSEEEREEWERRDRWEAEQYEKWAAERQEMDLCYAEEMEYENVQKVAEDIHGDFAREVEEEAKSMEHNVQRGINKLQEKWGRDIDNEFLMVLKEARNIAAGDEFFTLTD